MSATVSVAIRCLTGIIRPNPGVPASFMLFLPNGMMVMLRSDIFNVMPLSGQNATVCGVTLADGALLVTSAAAQPVTGAVQTAASFSVLAAGTPGISTLVQQVAGGGITI